MYGWTRFYGHNGARTSPSLYPSQSLTITSILFSITCILHYVTEMILPERFVLVVKLYKILCTQWCGWTPPPLHPSQSPTKSDILFLITCYITLCYWNDITWTICPCCKFVLNFMHIMVQMDSTSPTSIPVANHIRYSIFDKMLYYTMWVWFWKINTWWK